MGQFTLRVNIHVLLAVTLFVAILAAAFTAAPTTLAAECRGVMVPGSGNFSDGTCTKEVKPLTGSYVLGTKTIKIDKTLWCFELEPEVATGEFSNNTCQTRMVDSLKSTEVLLKAAENILCLSSPCGGATGLAIAATSGALSLETLGGLALTAEKGEVQLSSCDEFAGEQDIELCKDQDFLLTGVTKAGQKCNTEGLSAGEVLALLDLKTGTEQTSAKVLQPIMLAKVLNGKLEAKLLIKCGVVKVEVKGVLACLLLPGLANIATTESVEIKCELNKTTHDAVTGTCIEDCEELSGEPFEAKLGEKFEDAWIQVTLKGKPSKDIFIDD